MLVGGDDDGIKVLSCKKDYQVRAGLCCSLLCVTHAHCCSTRATGHGGGLMVHRARSIVMLLARAFRRWLA